MLEVKELKNKKFIDHVNNLVHMEDGSCVPFKTVKVRGMGTINIVEEDKMKKNLKKLLNKYKTILKGKQYKIGKKEVIFEGCGPQNILFKIKVLGIDTSQVSLAKLWVEYDNLNPALEQMLLRTLEREGINL